MVLHIVHIVMAICSACRLTEIVTQDRIFERVRHRWPTYLWTCSRCVSVWAGIITVCVYYERPWLNWPLALSYLYIVQTHLLNSLNALSQPRYSPPPMQPPSNGRALVLTEAGTGSVAVKSYGMTDADARALILSLASGIDRQNGAKP
jgi:hypothetical protein